PLEILGGDDQVDVTRNGAIGSSLNDLVVERAGTVVGAEDDIAAVAEVGHGDQAIGADGESRNGVDVQDRIASQREVVVDDDLIAAGAKVVIKLGARIHIQQV